MNASWIKSRLVLRLFVLILAVGTLGALIIASAEAFWTYRGQVGKMDRDLGVIGDIFRVPLAQSIWALDNDQIRVQVEGLARLPGVTTAELEVEQGRWVRAGGDSLSNHVIVRRFDLTFEGPDRRHFLGTLTLKKDVNENLARIVAQGASAFSLNVGIILLIALVVGGVFQIIVTRRLVPIAGELRSISPEAIRSFAPKERSTPVHDELDELVDSIILLKKKARDALLDAEKKERDLIGQQRFLDSILENVPSMLFVKDARTLRFVRFNRAGEDLLGVSRDQFIGKSDRDFFPSDQAEFFTSIDRQVIESRQVLDIPREPISTAANGLRTLHTKKIGVYDERGAPLYLLGISEDITDRIHSEELLQAAKDEAEKANRAKSEFLAGMSHDLRTPLNAILGFSDMIRQRIFGPLGNARYEEYVEDIHRSGLLLISMINDILDLSRIEAGKFALNDEEIDLAPFLDGIVRQISPLVDGAGLGLAIDVRPEVPLLSADTKALTQILNNLISNSVKFTPAGGTIRVLADTGGSGAVRILVADTGIGMSESERAKALLPFENANLTHPRKHEGTGLGLYLCSNLMALLGGSLEIDGAPGRGTTVTLRFPRERSV